MSTWQGSKFVSTEGHPDSSPAGSGSSPGTASGGKSSESLVEVYHRYFEIVPATTDEMLEEAYRLRYQVYCIENEFEDPLDNPGGLETDGFDSHADHSLLIHRRTGRIAGTVRLVLPDPEKPWPGLPIHRVCDDPVISDTSVFPPATTAEISRFAISRDFRRRHDDTQYPDAGADQPPPAGMPERRVIPHMTLGLLKGVMQMSAAHGITHWCAVMEPPLLRLLARLGLHLATVGPLVSYHGTRQPAYADIAKLAVRTKRERRDVWDLCSEDGRLLPSAGKTAKRGRAA